MDTRSGWDSDSDKHGAGPRGSRRKVRHLASRLGNGAYASLAELGAPVFQATAIPGLEVCVQWVSPLFSFHPQLLLATCGHSGPEISSMNAP